MILTFFYFVIFFQKSKIFQNPKFQFFPKSLLLILLIRPAFRPAFFPFFSSSFPRKTQPPTPPQPHPNSIPPRSHLPPSSAAARHPTCLQVGGLCALLTHATLTPYLSGVPWRHRAAQGLAALTAACKVNKYVKYKFSILDLPSLFPSRA